MKKAESRVLDNTLAFKGGKEEEEPKEKGQVGDAGESDRLEAWRREV